MNPWWRRPLNQLIGPTIARRFGKPLYHWQPVPRRHGITVNFGDALFALICTRLAGYPVQTVGLGYPFPRLLAGGSILQYADDGDTLWGVGLHSEQYTFRRRVPRIDVRAVRGPLTAGFLRRAGVPCPDVWGDPAILLPTLFPEFRAAPARNRVGYVPHFLTPIEPRRLPVGAHIIRPDRHPREVIVEILACELIVSESLHGLIVAEAFGIPARWVPSRAGEPRLKYNDYYASTDREPRPAGDVAQALRMGGAPIGQPPRSQALLNAFPRDIRIQPG